MRRLLAEAKDYSHVKCNVNGYFRLDQARGSDQSNARPTLLVRDLMRAICVSSADNGTGYDRTCASLETPLSKSAALGTGIPTECMIAIKTRPRTMLVTTAFRRAAHN